MVGNDKLATGILVLQKRFDVARRAYAENRVLH